MAKQSTIKRRLQRRQTTENSFSLVPPSNKTIHNDLNIPEEDQNIELPTTSPEINGDIAQSNFNKNYVYLSIGLAIFLIVLFISNTTVLLQNLAPQRIDPSTSVSALTESEVEEAEQFANTAVLNHLAVIFSPNENQYQTALDTLEKELVSQSPYRSFITSHDRHTEDAPDSISIKNTQIIDLQKTLANNQINIKVSTDIADEEYSNFLVTLAYSNGNYKIYNIIQE